jgi:two-component system sensor histidine kinase YesM
MLNRLQKKIFNLSLWKKFFLFTLLVSFIPVTFIGIFSYRVSQKYLKENVTETAIMKSEAVNSRLERYLSNIDDSSIILMTNFNVQQLLLEYRQPGRYMYENEVRNVFASILSSKTDIHSIALYDYDGNLRVYCANVVNDDVFKPKIAKNIETNAFFAEVKRLCGRRIWIKAFQDTDKISMVRVVNESGSQHRIGTLLITINEERLRQAIEDIGFTKESGSFLVFENNNNLIYSSGERTALPKLTAILQGFSDYRIISNSKRKFLCVDYLSRFCDWRIITLIPLKSLYAKVATIKQITLAIIIICILAVTVASILITNLLTKPIIKLSGLMGEVEKGNFNIRFDNSFNDEIGRLAQSFNSMLEKTRMLLDENVAKQKRLRVQELKALQAQINPHFLYNTLDTINWMAQSIEAEQISEVSNALANYYRLSLNKGAEMLKIKDEINQVKNYLTIQKIRYENYLNYDFEISEDILDVYIIKLTLQPIVENAIYHGIKEKTSYGNIKILGKREGDLVILEVWDNGKGMDAPKLAKIRASLNNTRADGFGLSNVNERLKLCFGERFGVEVDSMENIFTKVTITIPILKEEPLGGV